MKKHAYLLLIIFISSCGSSVNRGNDKAVEHTCTSLFSDPHFQNGFNILSVKEGNGEIQGVFDYQGKAGGSPTWRIAQWNNYNNDLLNAQYSDEDGVHTYRTANGNVVSVDSNTGSLKLGINTSTEYGKNGITSNPRKNGESWPHLLIEYVLGDKEILKISDKKEVRMNIAYNITDFKDRMPDGTTDKGLHTAQFQWYVTVQNRTQGSEDYGQYIWFGLSFFDVRYEIPPAYAAEDGGKEHNTGAFIYVPDMREILVDGKTEIGKDMLVDVDILPMIRSAFKLAQERNYLKNTTWDDLYITTSNIGWEVPGTYDATVRIDSLNIRYK
ncbi:MAG: hypothetical protein LBV43_12100 [Prevotella sp.]|jgi:hypothetical protein|nr:hypothetical protein [Prevotella sp.]